MPLTFDEEPRLTHTPVHQSNGPICKLLLTNGLADSQVQARNLMLILSVIFLVTTIVVFIIGGKDERIIDNTDPITGQPMIIPA